MKNKQHIYVLPEAFLLDQNVPARWRVWAIINGFFVNGEKCWAGNEWIGEKIKSHKDTVSKAVKELEDLGIISCKRTRRTRTITPILKDEIGTNAYQEGPPTPISDRHQRLSNSVSNSESLISSSAETEPERILEKTDGEGNPIPGRAKKVPSVEKDVIAVFVMFSKLNSVWSEWSRIPAQRQAAKSLLEKHKLLGVQNLVTYYTSVKDDQFAPKIYSPYDLLNKFAKLKAYREKQRA